MRIRGPIFQALTLIAFFAMVTVSNFVRSDVETTVTYYHSNFSGSPVATTSQNGAVLWTSDYLPYGKRYNTSQSADNDVWFTGHVEDDPAGLVYMEARYYDPDIGRFHGIDSVGFVESNPMSFNRYAYANNNPYKYVDPDGNVGVLAPLVVGATVLVATHNAQAPTDAGDIQPSFDYKTVVGVGAIVALSRLPYLKKAGTESVDDIANKTGKGLGNPLKDKSAQEIDQMFKQKGFRESGPDPINGNGGYVNPKTGRSYHIDPKEYGKYREPNHVDVNRPRGYSGLYKKKLPYKD